MSGLGVCRLFAARVARRVVAGSAAVVGAPHAGYPGRVMYSCGGAGGGRAPLHLMHITRVGLQLQLQLQLKPLCKSFLQFENLFSSSVETVADNMFPPGEDLDGSEYLFWTHVRTELTYS